jgi:SAM-dependent methyltransferase
MADLAFEEPRMAQLLDPLDPDRSDLEVYAAMVGELGVKSVLDVGCGTGTFACMLAARGIQVTGVDPAEASLDLARSKPGSNRVRWLHGDATSLPALQVDAAFMTGNVAQVFVTDEEWTATLAGVHRALRSGGHLVFEARDPSRRAWEEWVPELTRRSDDVEGVGRVEHWFELLEVRGELVSFRWTVEFASDGAVYRSDSTLRFRSREALEASLDEGGFMLQEVRDAPDRPGREFVFLASTLGDEVESDWR